MKKIVLCLIGILFLTACKNVNSNEIDNLYGKSFSNYNGNIYIEKKTEDYSVIYFDDSSKIKNVNISEDDFENNLESFDFPKVSNKSGKKFLVADGIEEGRFEIKSEELIFDTKTNQEYKLDKNDDINEKDIDSILGREYYTKDRDAYFKIVKKTKQYSYIDFKIPKSYFNSKSYEKNKDKYFILYSGKYDFPKVHYNDNKTVKYLFAKDIDARRFIFLNDDKEILDTQTMITYYLDEKSVAEK